MSFPVSLSSRTSLLALGLVALAGCLASGSEDEAANQDESALAGAACVVTYDYTNQWAGGFQTNVTIKNQTSAAYNGWNLKFSFAGNQQIQSSWNGKASQSGAAVSVTNETYNGSVAPGGEASFGFVASGDPGAKPTSFSVNGVKCNESSSSSSGGTTTSTSTSSSGAGGAGTTSSSTTTSGAGGSSGTGGSTGVSGFLHTSGGKIVDAGGNQVRLTGINWFGLETANYAPHGLWSQSMDWMLDTIKTLGYNTIRLPFCSQLFDAGSAPTGIDFAKNPDLVGKSGLEIMDKVIAGAKKRGLKVFLDRHRPDSGAQSELWYTAQYSETRWINDWKMLAQRYKDNTTVVGMDLHNEPHGTATWGTGNMQTDWQLAAERAGNAILSVNPNVLIIVEGVEKVGSDSYWWGGNLSAAGAHPVRLSVPNQLVYSPHDYPASVFAQPYFSDPSYPANLAGVWDKHWGYLAKQGTTPVLVGEFGTKLETQSDKQWLSSLVSYIKNDKFSFTYWCLNADSGDTGGILKDDWSSIQTEKQSIIQPALAPLIP